MPGKFLSSFPKQAPIITVIGESNLKVNPDLIKVNITLKSEKPDFVEAKESIYQQLTTIKEYCNKAKLELSIKQLSINQIFSESFYDEPRKRFKQSKPKSYSIFRDITILIHDFKNYENILMSLLSLSNNPIYNVRFALKDLQLHKDKARLLALKNAKKKAEIMAEKMDEDIDEVFSIKEENLPPWSEFFTNSKNIINNDKSQSLVFHSLNKKEKLNIPLSKLSIAVRLSVSYTLD